MARREIIRIDEELCDGCGNCVIDCAEGALEIVDGKAKLISDIYCDGLGACLGGCPTGALQIVQREAAEFDEEAVEALLEQQKQAPPEPAPMACGCPSSMIRELKPTPAASSETTDRPSALRNWPIQLHLAPVKAPFFDKADLLIAADCAGFSLTGLHKDFLPGRSLIIACPKLDEVSPYEDKLAAIFRENAVASITVLYMTVPCCFGLVHLVRQAAEKSGRSIPLRLVKVDPTGTIVDECQEWAA